MNVVIFPHIVVLWGRRELPENKDNNMDVGEIIRQKIKFDNTLLGKKHVATILIISKNKEAVIVLL